MAFRPGSRPRHSPRHSPRTGQRGRAVWALCGRCPGPGRGTRFLPPLCVPPDASPFSSGRRSEQVFTRTPLLRLSPNSVASWVRGGYDSNIQISGERMSAHSTAPVNYGSPRPSRTRERDGLGAETADRAGATPRGKLPRAPADLQTRRLCLAFHPGPCPRRRRRGPWLGLPALCRVELLALGSPPPWSRGKGLQLFAAGVRGAAGGCACVAFLALGVRSSGPTPLSVEFYQMPPPPPLKRSGGCSLCVYVVRHVG